LQGSKVFEDAPGKCTPCQTHPMSGGDPGWGFLAVSGPRAPHEAVWSALSAAGLPADGSTAARLDDVTYALWRDDGGPTDATDGGLAARVGLPPWFSHAREAASVTVTTDWLGFRQVYLRREAGWAAMSTHAGALAALSPTTIDDDAVADLAMMGWLIGDHTPWVGVTVLPPGSTSTLSNGQVTSSVPAAGAPVGRRTDTPDPVVAAAHRLREVMAVLLDEAPTAVLQLTGGLDSRVLLGAIPPERRTGLRAFTLAVPGSEDAPIAASLAAAHGLTHTVEDIRTPDGVDEPGWLRLAVESSLRLSASADPIARAVVEQVEASLEPQVRVAGLGGEVTRGFYYGVLRYDPSVTRARARRLTTWRLLPNGSVSSDVLTEGTSRRLEDSVVERVHGLLARDGATWMVATDEFYLWQRMRRWAGTLASAQPATRPTLNPMLDETFLDIARALPPGAKQGMRFLAALMCELDPQLAAIPLDGRPPPAAYLGKGRAVSLAAVAARKTAAKSAQRLRGARRKPPGSAAATSAIQHLLAADQDHLRAAVDRGIVSEQWYRECAAGRAPLTPAAAALLTNVHVADALARGESPT
jgi:asparagine synthase (glutamine-hydrolysing)